MITNEVRKQCR